MIRTLLVAFLFGASLTAASAQSAQGTHEARLSVASGGKSKAAVHILMEDGWKTYWKMPGDSGVPPSFDWSGSRNVKSVEVLYPAPERFQDAGGETIGYKHEVAFPLLVTAEDETQPSQLSLKMDYAVCKDVCIPAEAQLQLDLGTSGDALDVSKWEASIPKQASDAEVRFGGIEQRDGKLFLRVETGEAARDIFVNSDSLAYFGKPQPSGRQNAYELPVFNIKDPAKLKGKTLDIVVLGEALAYERHVKLD